MKKNCKTKKGSCGCECTKEDQKKIGELDPILNEDISELDLMVIQDVSEGKTKSVNIGELDKRWVETGGIPMRLLRGIASISSGVFEVTVSLGETLDNVDYVPSVSVENFDDSILMFMPFVITEKTDTAFKVRFNAPFPSGNYRLNWMVIA